MDTLQAMQVFARVVDAGGFSRAGDSIGLGTPRVSRLVQTLESRLGCRLLNRTTRSLALTDDGRAYYKRCVDVLNEIADMEASLSEAKSTPKGRVKASLAPAMAKTIVIPALANFVAQYPQIDVELRLTDGPVDLVGAGLDCAVCVGIPADSGLIAKKIGAMVTCTCAAPSYIERYGIPRDLHDMDRHVALNHISNSTGRPRIWRFQVHGEARAIPVKGAVSVNDADAYVACAVAGLGLARTSRYLVDPYLKSGQLVQVLEAFEEPPKPISVMYVPNRNLPTKILVFLEWLAALYKKHPALQGKLPAVRGPGKGHVERCEQSACNER